MSEINTEVPRLTVKNRVGAMKIFGWDPEQGVRADHVIVTFDLIVPPRITETRFETDVLCSSHASFGAIHCEHCGMLANKPGYVPIPGVRIIEGNHDRVKTGNPLHIIVELAVYSNGGTVRFSHWFSANWTGHKLVLKRI